METMAEILREESAALTRQQARQLEEATAAKIRHLETLQQLEQEREACFRSLAITGNPPEIRRRLDEEFAGSALGERWHRLLELGRECQQQNRLNGITIELGYHHVNRALQLVSGRTGDTESYGPGGRKEGTAASRLLGQA